MGREGLCLLVLAAVAAAPLPGVAAGDAARVVRLTLPGAPLLGPPAASGAAALGRRGEKTETALLAESFEATWPASPWRLTHADGAAAVDWGQSDLRASAGTLSAWCAGAGADAPQPGQPVPVNTESWAIVGPFDLSDATTASLSFDLWLRTEQFHDLFMWLVSVDGRSFSGHARSTDTDGWRAVSSDLGDWPDIGDVAGHSHVWVAFVYQSDHSTALEGAYLDEVALMADSGSVADEGYTYTSTSDFALGTAVGVSTASDQLELAADWSAPPFLWVPSPTTGTVSRVAVSSGRELGRYRTGPERELRPAAVAVDLEGSCWVGNGAAGSVVKVGLVDAGQCVDRDGDGRVDTSRDEDGDGSIETEEVLDWGDDECVLVEVVLVEGQERTHTPGDEHDDYADNDLQALAVDGDNTVWVGVGASRRLYRLDPSSGAVVGDPVDLAASDTEPFALAVDAGGVVWSTSWPDPWLLRFDPSAAEPAPTVVALGHGSRALVLDQASHLFVTGYTDGRLSRVDTSTGEVEWEVPVDWQANGVAVTPDGDLWVATPASGTVRRYSNEGLAKGTLELASWPSGVALDGAGKVWVVSSVSPLLVRVDPATGRVDLQKELLASGGHDTTSDLTGVVARSVTSRHGTWSVVHDSTGVDTAWGTVSWRGVTPEGTSTRVRVRSSRDRVTWSGWETASSAVALADTPAGRYLEVEVALHGVPGGASPVVEELTVTPVVTVVAPTAEFTWAPVEPAVGEDVLFTDASSGGPTSWSWSFGDGATSSSRSPDHAFAAAGTYGVTLVAGNATGSSDVTHQVAVRGCSLGCSATVPGTAAVGEEVAFAGLATATGCGGSVAYQWQLGDGTTASGAAASHAFRVSGSYPWSLTATADDEQCSASGVIAVTGGGPPECVTSAWVPVVSHADGAHGSVWRSDLGLLSRSGGETRAEVRYHGPDGVVVRTLLVAAAEVVRLADVVAWVGSDRDGMGALEVCADGALVVTSRTYNLVGEEDPCEELRGGTFGQYLDGVASDAGLAAGDVGVLSQLAENAAFRTNLGLANTGAVMARVVVHIVDPSGAPLHEYAASLAPGAQWQDPRPFHHRASRDDLDVAWAWVEVEAGEGVHAYASVVDNLTNDATTVPMRRER